MPTAERAEVVRAVVAGVDVLGANTLNGSVGGLNAVAVEIAGRQGSRIVWLPTVDSANERRGLGHTPPGVPVPMWVQLQKELADGGIVAPTINVLSSDLGQPFNPPVEDGLALFADRLLQAGFSEDDVHTMAVTNTRRVAVPAAA